MAWESKGNLCCLLGWVQHKGGASESYDLGNLEPKNCLQHPNTFSRSPPTPPRPGRGFSPQSHLCLPSLPPSWRPHHTLRGAAAPPPRPGSRWGFCFTKHEHVFQSRSAPRSAGYQLFRPHVWPRQGSQGLGCGNKSFRFNGFSAKGTVFGNHVEERGQATHLGKRLEAGGRWGCMGRLSPKTSVHVWTENNGTGMLRA